ncbi:MAG TPA: hypothetical protein VFZ70_18415 [Euzebyales bacterium]
MSLTTIVRRVDAASRIGAAGAGTALERRVAALRARSERGAQAAEYAMLGGVSAAACTGLVALFKNRETLRVLVDAVIGTLGRVIEGWF